MSYTIVSERQGVTSRDSRATPQEALLLASALVQSGVEKIWVYDELGQFVSATALSQIAQQQVGSVEPPAPAESIDTTDLLASDVDPSQAVHEVDAAAAAQTTPDTKLPIRSGPRVFRLAPQRS
jgi:hypothetical protein